MSISVAIPTYNRADELDRTLRILAEVDWPKSRSVEVLVIDNNSKDHTHAVVIRHEERFAGRLRYILEANQGLCHARNRAIADSKNEIVAFLDDDVDVSVGWLNAIVDAFSSDDIAAVGGRTFLIFPESSLQPISPIHEICLSRVEHGDFRKVADESMLFGVNLSISKAWLSKVGGFRTDLDRIGQHLLSGGETELLRRMSTAGGMLLYDPGAKVGHRVSAERLTWKWFAKRHYWGLRSNIRLEAPTRKQAFVKCCVLLPQLVVVAAGIARRYMLSGSKSADTQLRTFWFISCRAELMEYTRFLFVRASSR